MSVAAVPILLLLCSTCLGLLLNVTIDDEYGDELTGSKPEYEPRGTSNWLVRSDKTTPGVFDYSQVHKATLHEGVAGTRGNMTITFNGTAIYVFFVLNSLEVMDLLFYLDGASQPSGRYTRPVDPVPGPDGHLYNQLTFTRDGLHPGMHSVRVSFSPTAREQFDYALYTTDGGDLGRAASDAAPARFVEVSVAPPASKIASGVGASLAAAVVVIAFCVWVGFRIRRRMRRAQSAAEESGSGSDGVVPFAVPPAEPRSGTASLTSDEKSDNPLKRAVRETEADARGLARSPSESIALVRAELARVRAESDRARAENERVRQENELLRRIAVPPPYSDGGQSNAHVADYEWV